MIDALALARDLIRCRSVTPADDGAQAVLGAALGVFVHQRQVVQRQQVQQTPSDAAFAQRFRIVGASVAGLSTVDSSPRTASSGTRHSDRNCGHIGGTLRRRAPFDNRPSPASPSERCP